MKRFALLIATLLTCGIAFAHTINWHDGNTTTQSTCSIGDNVTPPTPIGKYGYHFKEWKKITKIDYLECTGTQYIDTKVNAKSSIRISLSILVPTGDVHSNIGPVFGARENSNRLYFWAMFFPLYNNQAIRFDYYNAQGITCASNQSILGKIVTIDMNNNHKVSIYDSEQNLLCEQNLSTTEFTTNASLFLLGLNEIDHISYTPTSKIYWAKIWDNNVLVRDFIPVLDPYGVPCMFDKVEHKFYYNAGTGQFIAGPVIQ